MFNTLSSDIRQYLLITANYWAFTLTDGALRMLVVLYFHQLGYSPLEIALLFAFYELFGVITNLLGGWLGARLGLNHTMNMGLSLQIVALIMLAIPQPLLTVVWVMAAQALSGIAKDLNKMSAKSAIKLLVPAEASNTLYIWVARLTGSKNTLKGVGFFLGGALLITLGFKHAVMTMACGLGLVWIISLAFLKRDLGRARHKPKITQLLSKSKQINRLSLARLFLFAARDVWFVVALPVFLAQQLSWTHWQIGGFMASWVILYGFVQTQAPKITKKNGEPNGKSARNWVALLSFLPAFIALSLMLLRGYDSNNATAIALIIGLLVFGLVFAINSSLHSFLIVNYASANTISMDVGFYYMANAAGRLLGTVLSGWVFQRFGLEACLIVSTALLIIATLASTNLPSNQHSAT